MLAVVDIFAAVLFYGAEVIFSLAARSSLLCRLTE
jgi:hypothetical protein